MSESKTRDLWTDKQQKYIDFLGRRKHNKLGEKRTNEQFAQAIGVNPDTLYTWKRLPGFKMAVWEAMVAHEFDDMGDMLAAMKAEAKGVEIFYTAHNGKKKLAKPNVNAFREVAKVYGLAVDRVDHTTDGKPLPQPVLPVTNLRQDEPPV